MKIETLSYLDEAGKLDPKCSYSIPAEILVKGLEGMLLTRHVDERMVTLQRQGVITFALRSYGEECCSVASAAALEMSDWLYPQYRESGVIFWRGYSVQDYIHHMFGNEKDVTLGRQMPNHFGSKELNVVTVSSPIATKIPHAAGCAYAMKVQKEESVAVCYFGDGATSEGDFHAGVNFASVRKAPAIFFCRNNGYAISTGLESQFASDGVAPKGIGYGIEAVRIDGNDFFAVHEAVTEARKKCIAGKGPVLIEAMTYRLGAHSTSDDPTKYRSEEELEAWKKKDPILRLRKYLMDQGEWSEEKEEKYLSQIENEVTDAIKEAKKAAPPPLRSLVEDVYFEVPPSLEGEYERLKQLFPEEGDHA